MSGGVPGGEGIFDGWLPSEWGDGLGISQGMPGVVRIWALLGPNTPKRHTPGFPEIFVPQKNPEVPGCAFLGPFGSFWDPFGTPFFLCILVTLFGLV